MKKLTVLSLFLFVFLLSSCELLEGIEDIDDVNDLIDDIEEYVPLEGIDEALKLATGGEIEGIFSSTEPLTYYFYLPQAIEVVLNVEADFDSRVEIRDYDSKDVVFETDETDFSKDVYTLIALDEGEYEIEISGYTGDTEGLFTLSLQLENQITTLELGVTESGDLSSVTSGFYAITIDEAGLYQFTVDADFDVMGIFTSLGGVVEYDTTDVLDGLEVAFEAGTYYLKVMPYDLETAGVYEVLFEAVEDEVDEPTELIHNETVYASLTQGELDLYHFTVPSGGYIGVDMMSEFDSYGRILALDGTVLFENDNTDYDDDFSFYTYLDASTYQLEVSSVEGLGEGDYELLYFFLGDEDDHGFTYTPISVGSCIYETVSDDEMLIFELVITETTVVDVYAYSGYDTDINIIDETYYEVAVDYDIDDFNIAGLTLEPGTYYLYVTAYDNAFDDMFEMCIVESDEPSDNNYGLSLNETVEQSLESLKTDIYTFTVEEAGLFTGYSNTHLNMISVLYDEAGNQLGYDDGFDSETLTESPGFKLENVVLDAGTYQLYVYGYDASVVGNYQLSTVFQSYNDIDNEILPSETVFGTIENDQESSYYFYIEEAGYISLSLDSGFDSYGSLYDTNDTFLEDDDELLAENDDASYTYDFVIDQIYLEPGLYRVDVKGFTSGEYGDYALTLTVIEGDLSDAALVEVNTVIESTLVENGYDWYEVELTENGTLVGSLDSDFDSKGYLINEQGGIIYMEDDTQTDHDFYLSWYLTPGTYYFVVTGYSPLEYGDYTFNVEFYSDSN